MNRALPALAAVLVLAACGSSTQQAAAPPARPGKHLVYVTHLGEASEGQIVIARLDGSGAHTLTDGYAPALSPDGRYVAFERCPRCSADQNAEGDLYLVGSSGGKPRRLLPDVHGIEWGRDSRTLLLTRSKEIAIASLDGGVRRLATGLSFQPRFSPDGRSVVYDKSLGTTPQCGPKSDVYSVPVAGGASSRLTTGGRSAFPVWGPRRIAYARYTHDCRIRTVWTMRPDGSQPRAVLQPPPAATRPGHYGLVPVAWLPGGRNVLGVNSGEFGNEAVVIDTKTGAVRPIGVPYDAVSRDGRWIVGTRSHAEFPFAIGIAPVASGAQPRVIAGGRVCCADWNR